MARVRIWIAAVLLASTAGCTGDGGSTVRPAPSATPVAAPVITEADAALVFGRYDEVNAAADAALDDTAIREVQTGVLLAESLATYDTHRTAGTEEQVTRYVRPDFLIPTMAGAPAFPRFFVVLSKRQGFETDRASSVVYFTQARDGDPWKATAATWVVTEAPVSPGGPAPSARPDRVTVTPKVLPGLRRTAGGTVELSPSADADRAVCADYAEYLSFSPPDGEVTDSRFVSGSFTGDLVRHYNGFANPRLDRSYRVRVDGERLPVLRFAGGGAFVACTFERIHRVSGTGSSGTVRFDVGSETDLMLGGGGREWRTVTETASFAALFEVPAGGAPATVLTCDCYGPVIRSAEGVRP